ncbi:MAG: DUF3237 domain-containing protein [Rhodanobacteraceae bacterium]
MASNFGVPAETVVARIEAPTLEFLAAISVEVGEPIELGVTEDGPRRIIPITGGTVTGPILRGRVLSAGADYQLLKSACVTELQAKYAIETDEGDHIYIDNFGLRTGDPDDIARLVRGEEVDPRRIYFRCSPRMQASGPRWGWLSTRILIATGQRFPDEVRLEVYVVK